LLLYKRSKAINSSLRLSSKEDIPGEHGCDARYLLLFVHDKIARGVGLEVEGDLAGHAGQVGEEILGRPVSL